VASTRALSHTHKNTPDVSTFIAGMNERLKLKRLARQVLPALFHACIHVEDHPCWRAHKGAHESGFF